MPKVSIDLFKITGYFCLSPNQGCLMYQTQAQSKTTTGQISLISIDIDNEVYELVGNCYNTSNLSPNSCGSEYNYNFCHMKKVLFIYEIFSGTLYIFHINFPSLDFKSYRKMNNMNSNRRFLFNLIDEKLIFAKAFEGSFRTPTSIRFQTIKDDNSFADIEDSHVETGFERMYTHFKAVSLFQVCLKR